MPVISPLYSEGIGSGFAKKQEIRPLRIGLVNSMPASAYLSTERQWEELLSYIPIIQIEIVRIRIETILDDTYDALDTYIADHTVTWQEAKEQGLDGLILTGMNFPDGSLKEWEGNASFRDIVFWAESQVVSILSSCMASHLIMNIKHNVERIRQEKKIWGIFPHIQDQSEHPLVKNMNTTVYFPHSRWNSIEKEVYRSHGYEILLQSEEAGVGLVVSPDFRHVMIPAHPEYGITSLAREYLRDKKAGICHEDMGYVTSELKQIDPHGTYTNDELIKIAKLQNIWGDSAKLLVSRWIDIIYHLTNYDIHKQYMDGISSDDPIGDLHQLQK